MSALLSFLPLLGAQKVAFVRATLLSLLTLAAGIALLGVSGWFLTAAAITTLGVAFNLFAPSAGVRGLSFVRILSRYGERVAGHEATLRLLADLRRWTFAHLFAAIPLAGAGLARADLVNRLVADVDALDTAFLTALGPMLSATLVALAMTAGLAMLMPLGALAYLACFALAALVIPALLIVSTRRPGAAVVEASANLRRAVIEGLDLHQDLVALDQTGRATMAAASASGALASARRRLARRAAMASAGSQAAVGLAVVAVFLGGLGPLDAGRIDGPLFVGLLLAVVASFEAAAPLLRGASRLSAAAAAATRLKSLGDLQSPLASPAAPKEIPAGGRLELRDVRYGYAGGSAVLDDLSLKVESGERVAIVGPSGSGKSTIAKLLVRLADPLAGSVRLNGIDLRDAAIGAVRRRVALMTQDAPVFNDTVRNNLRIGAPEADDATLWQALEGVAMADVVRALPRGLDAMLGEAGAGLSAGQARRIALARTLLAPADVVVLDEPTVGLDRPTETDFFGSLASAAAGRTLIVVTHAALPPGTVDRVERLVGGRLEPVALAEAA